MCPDSRSESSNRCPATRSPVRRLIVELPLKAYGMHRSASTLLLSGIMVASCATTSSPSPGSSAATPSEEPTATATPTAAVSPSPTVSASPTSSADLYGLANATLDVPVRPAGFEECAQGPRTKFVNGRSGEITLIGSASEADVDHDGALDVVAGIDCSIGEGHFRQLVAFHRRPDRTFATIGIVVQAVESPDYENEIANVYDMEITPLGEIRVGVGDYNTMHSDEFLQGVHQFRTYGWNGTAFVQTAGSTSFMVPAGTVDLSVNATPMTYAPPVNGMRAGTLTVTIRNDGATAVEDLSVLLAMVPGQSVCAVPGVSFEPVCAVGPLDPGATKTVTFHHSIPACESGSECSSGTDPRDRVNRWADLQVRIGDQKYSEVRGVPVVFR